MMKTFPAVSSMRADDVDRIGDVETLARYTDSVEKFREAPFAELQVDGGAGDFDDFTCCRHFFPSWAEQ